MNPFELSGPAFLELFVVAGLIAACATLAVRWLVGRPPRRRDPAELARRLHPTEVAFLLHDLDRAVEAAVAGLHHRGAIELDGGTLKPSDRPGALEPDGAFRGVVAPERGSLVEDHVLSRLPATVRRLCEEARASRLPAALAGKLEGEGLLVHDRGRATWLVRLPALAWLATGAIKLAIGSARDRPIGELFLLLLVGGALVVYLRAPRLTSLGRAVRRQLRALAGLELTAQTAPQQLSGTELSLAYAIFGHAVAPVAVMAVMPSYQAAMLGATAAASGGGSSSCGGSSAGCGGGSSCGSSCGGCGGCS